MSEKKLQAKIGQQLYSHGGDGEELEIRDLILAVKDNKMFIAMIMLAILVLSILYVINIPPLYQTSALVQIEGRSSGMSSMLSSMSNTAGYSNDYYRAGPSQIEQALITSRFILEPTITSLGLNISAQPRYFPVFGAYMFHRYHGRGLAKPLWGLSKYAWGGEKLTVSQLTLPMFGPDDVKAGAFLIEAKKSGLYRLYTSGGRLLLNGVVGQITESNNYPGLKILVSKLYAHPGTQFSVYIQPIEPLVDQIGSSIKISDLGIGKRDSWLPSETGVLNVMLQGSNSEMLPKILNTIISNDIQKNTEKKSVEAQKTLNFLNEQARSIRGELNQAETALSNYKSGQGALGVSAASQVLLDQYVGVSKEIEELKLKKILYQQEYTNVHPYIIALSEQQKKMQHEKANLESKVSMLPKSEQKMLSLEREVKVKDGLYVLLLDKIQQMQIIKEGTMSDVRILGAATRVTQIPNSGRLIILAGLLLGFVSGVGTVLARYFLSRRINDPDYIEEHLHVPLFAIVPFSRHQKSLVQDMKRGLSEEAPFVLAIKHNQDMAIEGLRSLRTTLQLSMQDAKNNIVTILGASPSIGKSFISLNLAYVLSDIGKKVLVIDADMRNGKMNKYLGMERKPGLSDILSGKVKFEKVKRMLRRGKLDFISSGDYPSNPADLLYGDALESFLQMVAKIYDVVIIDTPPVLTMADAVTISKHAGVNLLLVGASIESFNSLKHTIRIMHKNDIVINGLIFNNTKAAKGSYGYGKYKYYYHGYYGKGYGKK